MWVGALTPTSARVVAKVEASGSVYLNVGTGPDLSGPRFGPVASSSDGIVHLAASGLEPDTAYYYGISLGNDLDPLRGRMRTHPPTGEPASFTYAMATCGGHAEAGGDPDYPGVGDVLASNRQTNHPVFDRIREHDPLFFIHGGDLHYYDIGSGNHGIEPAGELATFRRGYDDVLAQPRQHELYRTVPLAYVWDDHDFGPNDSDRTAPGRDNACRAYRERVPHYPLPAGEGANPTYQSFQVGRVLFLMSDVRAERDPNGDPQTWSKTMLGTQQKRWMEHLLSTTEAEALVWVMPSQWNSGHVDAWGQFMHERAELVEMFGDLGWLNRMCINSGDAHALSIDTGGGHRHGGFPIYQFSSLDSEPSPGPSTDTGPNQPGRGQYGLVNVVDRGHTIEVTGTGYRMGQPWRSHTWYAHVGNRVFGLDAQARGLGDIVEPFTPVLDDQAMRNDVTASRPDGGEEHVDDEEHVAEHGRFDESVTVAVDRDDQLLDQAGWRVHRGTWPDMRYPQVAPALNVRPELVEDWLQMDLGDQIRVGGLPPQHPLGAVELLAQGYTETIEPHRWDVEVNTSPAGPSRVGQTGPEEQPAPNRADRADTTGAALIHPVGPDETEWRVRTLQDGPTDYPVWVTSLGPGAAPDQLPVDLQVGGEVVRATDISSLGWDAFDRTVTGGWGEADSGQDWHAAGGSSSDRFVDGAGRIVLSEDTTRARFQILETPELDEADLAVTMSADQFAEDASLAPSIVVRYLDEANFYVVRTHLTAAGNVYLSLSHSTTSTHEGEIGGNVSTGFTYEPGQRFRVRTRIWGQRVLARLWHDDGRPEPGYWQLDRTVETDPLAAGRVGVAAYAYTDNTNDDVRLTFEQLEILNPQTVTVRRAVNSITASHDEGARVALANPTVIAL